MLQDRSRSNMSVRRVLFGLLVCAATLGLITSEVLNSPCPALFHYDDTHQTGKWTGTVTLLSDADLHGLWIRLLFDRELKGVEVDKNFGTVVPSPNNTEFLIKNREFLLKTATPVYVKITVKYEGGKAPRLIGYRLNAEMVCSIDIINSYLPFRSDFNNEEFLTSIIPPHLPPYKAIEGCGTTPLKDVQYPWQAAVYYKTDTSSKYICEATLISSRYILLPAHCVSYQKTEIPVNVKNLEIHLGSFRGGILHDHKVERVVLHPRYRANGLLNDLAVAQLDQRVRLNDYMRPICLGNSGGKNGVLVGYMNDRSNDLGQANVEIIEECDQDKDLGSLVSDNVLCGKYVEGNQTCIGNSGSSLVTLRGGTKAVWELKGIVTVGVALQNKDVCDHSSAILMIDVSRYLKWIQAAIS